MEQSRNWIALDELNLYVQVVVMTTEDEVTWKRLAVEGNGGIDDKRIMSLVKTFSRWVQSSHTMEEMDATYYKMLFTLNKVCSPPFTALLQDGLDASGLLHM